MNKQKSFTLIELLVVIVIIGILAGVIMISTSSSIDKANLAKAQAFSKTVQNELLLDLVSEWTFDEPEVSGKTLDAWGNNDGAVYGAGYKSNNTGECIFGGCYLFDGLNDYIDCGVSHSMDMQNEFSLFSWVRAPIDVPDATRVGNIMGNYSNSPCFNLEGNSNGRVRVWWNGEIDLNSTNFDLRDNNWHYIGFIRDLSKNKMQIYIDGKGNASTGAGTTLNINWPLRIGGDFRATPGIPFHGFIDDIRIYHGALSLTQIKQNYIAGLDSLLSSGSISREEYNNRVSELAEK